MKRKLAKEALYSSDHGALRQDSDPFERVTEARIKEVDPDGSRALAILKEFEQMKPSAARRKKRKSP